MVREETYEEKTTSRPDNIWPDDVEAYVWCSEKQGDSKSELSKKKKNSITPNMVSYFIDPEDGECNAL